MKADGDYDEGIYEGRIEERPAQCRRRACMYVCACCVVVVVDDDDDDDEEMQCHAMRPQQG